MIKRIREYIRENGMIRPKDKVLVGISGGPDSVCLLFALLELVQELDFTLMCVHVNHGLREEAIQDEAFVRNLCEAQGIFLVRHTCDVRGRAARENLTLEEAGRMYRYEAFHEDAQAYQCNRIAVAHHANDQAETMLFHLFRGTGIRGLSGMEPVRGKIIRPLLCVEQDEILQWLGERELSWRTDQTNMDQEYTRNRIRHTILSCAQKQINAQSVRHMADTGTELREIERYLEEETEKACQQYVQWEKDSCRILGDVFGQLDPVLRSRLFRRCLKEAGGGLRDMERIHIQLLEALWEKKVGSRLDLPGGRSVYREYTGLCLCCRNPVPENLEKDAPLYPAVPGTYVVGKEKWTFSEELFWENTEKTYTKWFDYDKIKKSLEIRRRMPGDYLEINQEHGRKKLKDYLIDQKVPREQRGQILLLADGSHIMWIPGRRISEGYKVTESTKRILKVQIYGGKQDG